MKPERLKPIRDREIYSKLVQQKIEYDLYAAIFKPVLDILGLSLRQATPRATKQNASARLIDAIESTLVTYFNGYFVGFFTASISKEIKSMGGVFDSRKKAWKIDPSKLPMNIHLAIGKAKANLSRKTEDAVKKLDEIQKAGVPLVSMNEVADGIVVDLNRQFEQTTAASVEIPLAMTGYIEDKIKTEYKENLNLYIKDWSNESILRLREKIVDNSLQGYRAENMRQAIEEEFGVTQRKAKFLARQETSILVSAYRENNYKEAGINFYQWSTSHDGRVRDSHKDLNGRIFSWTEPPIVDPAKGRRGHPGQDFGCRCVAVPVLQTQMERITEMAKNGQAFKGDLTNV